MSTHILPILADATCAQVQNLLAVDEIKIFKCPDNLSQHNQFCSAILDC